ncbi:unnamed protein product, partial [Meganyctiphanes norvegica]
SIDSASSHKVDLPISRPLSILSHGNSSQESIRSRANSSVKSNAEEKARKNEMRVTCMMGTIFLCFIICFLPLIIVNIADDDTKIPSIHVLASVLAYASAVVNPFVYAVSNRQYHTAYKQLFTSAIHCKFITNSKKKSCRPFITDVRYIISTEEVIFLGFNNPSRSLNA